MIVAFYPLETEDPVPQHEDPIGTELQEEILYGRGVTVQDGFVEGKNGPRPSRFVTKLGELHFRRRRLYFALALDRLFPIARQTVLVHEGEGGPLEIGLIVELAELQEKIRGIV